jgi:uncharacterized Tic20 family protein
MVMEDTSQVPTIHKQDERILAALAHGAILLPIYGILIPAIIWITQKEKSRYVSFQSLQALVFHLTLLFLYLIGMFCYFVSFLGMFGGMFLAEGSQNDWMAALSGIFPFAILGGFFCIGIFFVIYGAVGAILSLVGKDFRYLLIGNFIESRLQKDSEEAIISS